MLPVLERVDIPGGARGSADIQFEGGVSILTTPEIAFPTGYMVPPLSAVPIVRIFNESDAAPVWPCAGADAFPHPPSDETGAEEEQRNYV